MAYSVVVVDCVIVLADRDPVAKRVPKMSPAPTITPTRSRPAAVTWLEPFLPWGMINVKLLFQQLSTLLRNMEAKTSFLPWGTGKPCEHEDRVAAP